MGNTQIIGFAGHKQAGKDTGCNFILATKIAELGISKSSRLTKSGEIEVTDIFNESISGQEWMPFKPPHVDVEGLFDKELGKFVKIYSFAQKLKQLCVDVLGLDTDLVFGNDQQKNTKTHIKWDSIKSSTKKKGYMTVREVLQYVGTDMFRGLDPTIWVNACINQIKKEQPELALVSDVRFENEVKAIQEEGGYVIGLTRSPFKKPNKDHVSEPAPARCLDICDIVIDNASLSIPEQNEQIYLAVENLDGIPDISNSTL